MISRNISILFHSFLFSLLLVLDCLFDVWIGQNVAPEACNLVGVIDLHHVELLQDLDIDASLLGLEIWNNGFTKIDDNYLVQDSIGLNIFLGLIK